MKSPSSLLGPWWPFPGAVSAVHSGARTLALPVHGHTLRSAGAQTGAGCAALPLTSALCLDTIFEQPPTRPSSFPPLPQPFSLVPAFAATDVLGAGNKDWLALQQPGCQQAGRRSCLPCTQHSGLEHPQSSVSVEQGKTRKSGPGPGVGQDLRDHQGARAGLSSSRLPACGPRAGKAA